VNQALQVTLHDLELGGTGTVRSCDLQLMLFTIEWWHELASSGVFENLLNPSATEGI